jgi:hypothetical protein
MGVNTGARAREEATLRRENAERDRIYHGRAENEDWNIMCKNSFL